MASSFRNSLAIMGLGMITGPQPGKSRRVLEAEAVRLAIEDAGLRPQDIDGAIQAPGSGGAGMSRPHTDAFPRVLGLPVKFYLEGVCRGGAHASPAIMTAAKFLELGIAKYVAIVTAVNGWSRSRAARQEKPNQRGAETEVTREGYWGKPFGDARAVSHHSFFASRHMYEYGTTSRQLGAIAVAQRQWACLNPRAKFYGRPITLEDHQNSDLLVYPYHLLDICVYNDGAVAVILTTADRAQDAPKPPVYIMGIGFGEAMEHLWWEKKNYTRLAVETAKAQAFEQAGIELKDIDVAQLYDCFTAEVLFQMEDYGWCEKGEGGPFVEEGHLGPTGDLPINTSGGLLSAYHFGDMTGLSEAILQLRNEAGERQVRDAEIALVTGHGGEVISPAMCSIHTTLLLGR